MQNQTQRGLWKQEVSAGPVSESGTSPEMQAASPSSPVVRDRCPGSPCHDRSKRTHGNRPGATLIAPGVHAGSCTGRPAFPLPTLHPDDLVAAFRAVVDLKSTPGTGQLSQLILFAACACDVCIGLWQSASTTTTTKNLTFFIVLMISPPGRIREQDITLPRFFVRRWPPGPRPTASCRPGCPYSGNASGGRPVSIRRTRTARPATA